MEFIEGKCKCLYLRKNYPRQYCLGAKQLCRKRPGAVGRHQVEHEPGMCLCSRGGQQLPGLYQEECCQWVEDGDPAPLLSTGGTHLECWAQLWAPQHMPG